MLRYLVLLHVGHKMNPRNVSKPPTHLTRAQAARLLKIPMVSIYWHCRKGGPFEVETWWETPMIPMEQIMAFRTKQGRMR